jgi:hypothetical protein
MGRYGDSAERWALEHLGLRFPEIKRCGVDCADYETNERIYEVKSCQLVRRVTNGVGSRTHHYGRFYVVCENHWDMLRLAKEKGKQAWYLFIVCFEDQKLWRERLAGEFPIRDEGKMNLSIAAVFR